MPISNELRDAETVGQMIIGTLVTSAFTFDSQWLQVYHSLENVNHPIVPQMRKFHPLSILILSPLFSIGKKSLKKKRFMKWFYYQSFQMCVCVLKIGL